MVDLIIAPGMVAVLLAGAGLLLLSLGLWCLPAGSIARAGAVPVLTVRVRLLLGQAVGLVVALLVLLPARAQALSGLPELLAYLAALAGWLGCGVVWPRQPRVAAERKRAALRALVPGFASATRVALAGGDAPVTILERYASRTDRHSAPLRELVRSALARLPRERLRPFAALAAEARQAGCQALIDLADALAQAEADGLRELDAALARQARTLEAVLQDEWQRRLERRKLVLLLLVAVSVVGGVLGNLLWVMLGSVLLGGAI